MGLKITLDGHIRFVNASLNLNPKYQFRIDPP